MAELTPEIVGEVITACRSAADEIVASLSRALDGQFIGVTIGEAGTYDAQHPPDGFDGPGLAIVLQFGEVGAVALLPESCGLLPAWYSNPDPTGRSQLSTLAQELGMLLMPPTLMVDEFHGLQIGKMAETLAKAEPAAARDPGAAWSSNADDKQGQLSLIWPLAKPGELLIKPAAEMPGARADGRHNPPRRQATPRVPTSRSSRLTRKACSKSTCRYRSTWPRTSNRCRTSSSSCRGRSSSSTNRATSCWSSWSAIRPIAEGEVVKVGDKFGLRVQNMILPQERFIAIQTTMAS